MSINKLDVGSMIDNLNQFPQPAGLPGDGLLGVLLQSLHRRPLFRRELKHWEQPP